MTQDEERYYEIGEASYEWVGERGDTEFRLGAEWADENPRKGLVDIDKACKWLEKNLDCMASMTPEGEMYWLPNCIDNFRKAMEL